MIGSSTGTRQRLRLRSLRVRIPALAMAVLAVSLAIATFVVYELLLVAGRNDVDVVLEREQARFRQTMAAILVELTAGERDVTRADLADAATVYLELNPSTESYLTIVRLDGREPIRAANGPDALDPLFDSGALPEGTPNLRETIDGTPAGPIRSATSPILLNGERVGEFQVVTPLEPIQDETLLALRRLVLAAGLSLVLGAVLLAAVLWKALRPLQELATAARATELKSLTSRVAEPETDDEVGSLAREVNHMLDRLERANRGRQQFLASVSHELRTPITIVRGHLEVLEKLGSDDPAVLAETVPILRDELQRMSRLVGDLMAIARSESPDFVVPVEVDLAELVDDLRLRLTGLGVPGVVVAEPPPVVVRLDPDRLAQAVLNLVVNADVHTPPGTSIAIRTAIRGRELVVVVADDGPGIPDAIRGEVFEPFVRGAPSDGKPSSGLGLSVVQAVVEAHGGRVALGSGPSGTKVALHLPEALVETATPPGAWDGPACGDGEPHGDTVDRHRPDHDGTARLPTAPTVESRG